MNNTTTNTAAAKNRKLHNLSTFQLWNLVSALNATMLNPRPLIEYTDEQLASFATMISYERNSVILRNIANALTK
jgi:hypothetical protein